MSKHQSHLSTLLLALLVTFLWSTSFVIIKIGLAEIPPLTFAGLRYTIAFICLLPFAFTKKNSVVIKNLDKKDWLKLVLLGFLFYAFTQGTQFIGLSLLPSVTVSLWLNFTPLIVALMAIFLINEYPTTIQWAGVVLFVFGIFIYFFPVDLNNKQTAGLIVMTIGVLANSASAVLGRSINREVKSNPVVVTVISMGIGSIILLVAGILVQGLPAISKKIYYIFYGLRLSTRH
ncbi:MAG: DMT family transporter [bacterium]|nr:DMT family transporter [bacterium]